MPGLFDLPLAELKRYGGRNPRPADFDEYWQRAGAELDATDLAVELVDAQFQVPCARCRHLYFTGVGDARVHAKLLQPAAVSAPGPAVLLFHGYRGSSPEWSELLGYVAAGFTVAALDCRGQGGESEDPGGVRGNTLYGHIIRGLADGPDQLLYRQIFLDTAALARIVMALDDVDAARVGATGASQGGGLTLACAALEPRIRRAAPVYPFLCDYQRVWQMDQAERAYRELRDFFRMCDPTHEREHFYFERLGYIDVQHLAGRIRAQVLMGVGLMDQVCPPSTQFAAYNKITSPKEMVIYPDFEHEPLPMFRDRVLQFMLDL